jgi:hypothetical protein
MRTADGSRKKKVEGQRTTAAGTHDPRRDGRSGTWKGGGEGGGKGGGIEERSHYKKVEIARPLRRKISYDEGMESWISAHESRGGRLAEKVKLYRDWGIIIS